MSSTDPFMKRNEGGVIHLGDENEGGTSALIPLSDCMLVITRKSVHKIQTPDAIDPKRTNPDITMTKQKILLYGSDDPIIGRSIQQADVLLKNGVHRFKTVNPQAVMYIAFDFAKEIIALKELSDEYLKEEATINGSFKGQRDSDNALSVPSIPKVDQKVNQFILTADIASKCIMQLAQQFYPDLKNELWNVELINKVKSELNNKDQAVIFVESLSFVIHQLRNLRNAISHKKTTDQILVENYRQLASGLVVPPTIRYDHKETPLKEMNISDFMESVTENLLTCFEMLMVHLCNSRNAENFGDMIMGVVEVPESDRGDHEKHVGFRYAMFKIP
jgi:hypothetical protein